MVFPKRISRFNKRHSNLYPQSATILCKSLELLLISLFVARKKWANKLLPPQSSGKGLGTLEKEKSGDVFLVSGPNPLPYKLESQHHQYGHLYSSTVDGSTEGTDPFLWSCVVSLLAFSYFLKIIRYFMSAVDFFCTYHFFFSLLLV